MLAALIEGHSDPATMAELAKGRLRRKRDQLTQALAGWVRPHHRFVLSELLCQIDSVAERLARFDETIVQYCAPFEEAVILPDTIPWVARTTAELIVSEIGIELTIAMDLVKQALAWQWPFKAVVADSFYGEDATVREYLHERGIGFVMALKPAHSWWHFQGEPGSPKEIAQMPDQAWTAVERTFRDGHRERRWALEIQAGPYGPRKLERAVVVTTDPETLPEFSTWYLVTNLPLKNNRRAT